MKRFIILLLVMILLSACGVSKDESVDTEQNEQVQESADETTAENMDEKEIINSEDDSNSFDKVFSNPAEY